MGKKINSWWLFDNRPRQGKTVLPDGLNWLCYFAGNSKSHRENSISFIFLEFPHKVDIKNVAKCQNHFFGYFNALKNHGDEASILKNTLFSPGGATKKKQLKYFANKNISTTLMPPGPPGVSKEAKSTTEFEFGILVPKNSTQNKEALKNCHIQSFFDVFLHVS